MRRVQSRLGQLDLDDGRNALLSRKHEQVFGVNFSVLILKRLQAFLLDHLLQ